MCGIWAVFGSDENVSVQCNAAHSIAHRGPDCFRIENFSQLQLGEEYDLQRSTVLDGEPLVHLYQRLGAFEMARLLDGVFAFVILDMANKRVVLGRDTYGVKPMMRFLTKDGFLAVCSEAKGLFGLSHSLSDADTEMTPFPPGHVEIYDLDCKGKATLKERACFNKPGQFPLYKTSMTSYAKDAKVNIANLLEAAVDKRLMSDRRIGCLLSGGLDSSLVAALCVKIAKKRGLFYKIQTFAIGMEGSPDVAAARKVADFLETEHHEILMTPEEGLTAIPDVIYHLESYDVIGIRASIPMFLLSKYIKKNTDTTVILSGEGSDELTQGYIYFHKAPTPEDADKESRIRLTDLHQHDVLRADRTTAAWGLEIRLPFLDHLFTSYFLSLDPRVRQPKDGIEKHLLRSSFDGAKLIPDEILWRPKEGFSDGIASIKKAWFEYLQEYSDKEVSKERLDQAEELYPHNTPRTTEAMYYRELFEKHYPCRGAWLPYFWMPRWTASADPSARALEHYKQ